MALGGQQRDLGALALQQRVGRNRGAMHQALGRRQHLRAREVQPARELFQPRHDADRLIRGRRRRLCKHGAPGLIDGDEVGEGAADVNSDREHCSATPLRRSVDEALLARRAARASADRLAGGPHPPPPAERTSRQSPGRISMPISLVRNTRGARPSDSRR